VTHAELTAFLLSIGSYRARRASEGGITRYRRTLSPAVWLHRPCELGSSRTLASVRFRHPSPQLRRTHNPLVPGSNPGGPTNTPGFQSIKLSSNGRSLEAARNAAPDESQQADSCARLRYSSEGGNLRPGAMFRAFENLPRPDLWPPYVFTSPEEAAEAGLCKLS
jgi:hypothetical protein